MRIYFRTILFGLCLTSMISSCSLNKYIQPASQTKTIELNSAPSGARVYLNGELVCNSTPGTVTINTPAKVNLKDVGSTAIELQNQLKFKFVKDGYETKEVAYKPDVKRVIITPDGQRQYANVLSLQDSFNKELTSTHEFTWPNGILCEMQPVALATPVVVSSSANSYAEDPTIVAGEAGNMVSRDNPGGTALERTIIRWFFDSDPRGARIYYRVISSVPSQVKNTNEAYMSTTPLEETKGFNILGLTYENSRDVQIEVKVTKKGYEDQVKRFNVRQAIDQQEISSFFELVPK